MELSPFERQPVSKRRCIGFIEKGVVVPLAAGMCKGLVSAWQPAPEAPKAEAPAEEKK